MMPGRSNIADDDGSERKSKRRTVAANHRNFIMSGRSTADYGSERKSKRRTVAANHRNFTMSRRSTADYGSERKSKTTRVNDLNGVCVVYPYKWRRCLPREIVFEILLRLPALVIHDVMRRVYDEWKLMISTKDFIYNHLWNSTPGIIIKENNKKTMNGIYVEMRRGRLEMCKFNCRDSYLCGNSVNGLVLAVPGNKGDKEALYIINPLTEQREAVPYDFRVVCLITLALGEASMKYKAVRSFHPKFRQCVSVLTIGVDNDWRHLDMKHVSRLGRESLYFPPFATRGYVHWIGNSSVLTLNVETEIIYEFPRIEEISIYSSLAMGRNLSCCYLSEQPAESGEYLMEVIEMNPETGEWTKLLSSDLKPLSDRFKRLKSIKFFGVLGGGEVFLFGSQKLCAAYNVRTREIQSFELEKKAGRYIPKAHVNSMIWYK